MSIDEIEAYLTKKIMKNNPEFTVNHPIMLKCSDGYSWGGFPPGIVLFAFCRVCPKVANCNSIKRIIKEMCEETVIVNYKINMS